MCRRATRSIAGCRFGREALSRSALEKVLKAQGFDRHVEELCERFYKAGGRPSIPPGVYFRCLLVGLFEGIDSERGIAWRVTDSMSLRSLLGLPLGKNPPDHSTLSRTRRLISYPRLNSASEQRSGAIFK